MKRRKCQSCAGKGWIKDTTYVCAGGEVVDCQKCYGTGKSQEYIYRLLAAQRMRARQDHPRPREK